MGEPYVETTAGAGALRGPSDTLVHELAAELALATSGGGFIASCLDRLCERLELQSTLAVLHDPVLGPQIFTAGRRPLPLDATPSAVLARGAGIHTEPTVLDHRAELEAVHHLCEVALRLDRLQYESRHDPLTGLYNRRGFDAQLVQAVSRAQRYRWTFALVLLDLDGFKHINDRLGHQRGDAVLRAVGERLRLGLRAGDVAARIGGDEFALLVHVDADADVFPVLHRLGTDSILLGGEAPEVGWTVGVAACPNDGATADDLYRVADTRLYEAKSGGRRSVSGGAI